MAEPSNIVPSASASRALFLFIRKSPLFVIPACLKRESGVKPLSSIDNPAAHNRVTNHSSHLPPIKWSIPAPRFKITRIYHPCTTWVYHSDICCFTNSNAAFVDTEYPGRIYRHL